MLLFDTYKLTKLISLDDEPYLEKWARLFRYNTSLPVIKMLLKKKKQIALLDVGCGQDVLYSSVLLTPAVRPWDELSQNFFSGWESTC